MRKKIRNLIFENRTKELIELIKPQIVGDKILDIGSGNGLLSKSISDNLNKEVSCIDIKNYNKVDLPFYLYDGKKLPFKDNSFDTALFIYVLHHTKNQIELIKEAMRVAKYNIVIIENTYKNGLNLAWVEFLDYLVNKLYHNVKAPLNFRTAKGWKELFNLLGYKFTCLEDLKIGYLGKLGVEIDCFCLEINKREKNGIIKSNLWIN